MTDAVSISKRFETPLFDSLKPQHQDLVRYYAVLLDKTDAAIAAGYKNTSGQLKATVQGLFADPTIVAAIDEFLKAKLEQLDSGRSAICERLLNQSLATIYDVAMRIPYVNGNGTEIVGKFSMVPRAEEDVEPRFRCAICFLTRNTDGTYGWDNMSQHRAVTTLSKLMMWDQSILDQAPALNYEFGAIQSKPYVAPSKEVDLGIVTNKKDEVEQLTH